MGHAQLSPSAWKRWSTCPGSVALCRDLPDTSSAHADEGTAAHEMAEYILTGKLDKIKDERGHYLVAENGVPFTAEMEKFVRNYTDEVKAITILDDGYLFVEQRLPISTWTGEEGAHGTSDAVILLPDELVVADLKYGRGVKVEAEGNGQLMIYALAALERFGGELDKEIAEILGESWCGERFKTVRICIGQPRLDGWSEHAMPVEELLAFGEQVKARAAAALLPDAPLNPTPEGCRWCKAKATCPAASAQVVEMVFDGSAEDFADIVSPQPANTAAMPTDKLGRALSMADFIEGWVKAVRAEAERRLLAGEPVEGFKLVQGRAGRSAWKNPEEAEAALKLFRLKADQMYEFKLISPTKARELAEGENPVLGPRQAKKLADLIHRPEGSLSVAPVTDPRPAVNVSSSDDVSDLL